MTGLLEEIQDLNLAYNKAMPMNGGKRGAWVSEQYLGFSKIMVWWFSIIQCTTEDDIVAQPFGEQKGWNKEDNVRWLKERELSCKGYAADVKKRVKEYMERPEGPPEIVRDKTATAEMILQMITSLYSVLSLAMTEQVDKNTLVELRFSVKRFMTDFENVDAKVRPKRNKARWVTTFNIAGLQNIIEEMWCMGPLRNFWEGGFGGEGYLRLMKPQITMGLRKNWQQNLMKKLFRNMALCRLLMDNDLTPEEIEQWEVQLGLADGDQEEEIGDDTPQVSYSDFCCYTSRTDILHRWKRYSSFSLVLTVNGDFRLVMKNRREWIRIEKKVGREGEQDTGLHYFAFELGENVEDADMDGITHGCLLLPHLTRRALKTDRDERWYTVIRSDWKHWNGDGFETMLL
jgi:hypothetical protein